MIVKIIVNFVLGVKCFFCFLLWKSFVRVFVILKILVRRIKILVVFKDFILYEFVEKFIVKEV